MRRYVASVVAASIAIAACSARRPATEPEEILFNGTLQELAPHHNGDHFIYRVTATGRDDSLQVEHLTALDAPGEFVVDMSENGTAIGRQHVRDDGAALLLMSEGLLAQDLIITYEQPLPSLAVPLATTPRRARSAVTFLRGDGKVVAHGSVEQTVTAHRSTTGGAGAVFEVRTERTVVLLNRTMRLAVTTWLAPGMGEVRSEGSADGEPPVHRELLCAIIEGNRVGDKCDQIAPPQTEN
ncbi:MAG TPA: hypothetical protein VL403_08415 [Candidatus Kryptonia bacterium]|nr:hypothetical protein [Candidatus Kryptonia bacterium]